MIMSSILGIFHMASRALSEQHMSEASRASLVMQCVCWRLQRGHRSPALMLLSCCLRAYSRRKPARLQ